MNPFLFQFCLKDLRLFVLIEKRTDSNILDCHFNICSNKFTLFRFRADLLEWFEWDSESFSNPFSSSFFFVMSVYFSIKGIFISLAYKQSKAIFQPFIGLASKKFTAIFMSPKFKAISLYLLCIPHNVTNRKFKALEKES